MKRSILRTIAYLLIALMVISMFLPYAALAAPGTKCAVTTQPAGATSGVAFTTQPVVTIQDAAGVTDTAYIAPVTLAITAGTGTAGAVLAGTATVNAVAGVATFAGLSINLAGTGYTLTATSGALTPSVSTPFNVAPGAAAKVAFTTQPALAASGAAFLTQPVVTIQDAAGNTVTASTAAVTLAITTGTGTAGAVLSGTATVNAVAGVATFAGLGINLAGNGYTLTAASTGLTAATSAAFNVAGAAAKVAFTTQPAGATSGVAFTNQPVVTIQDAAGNRVTTSTAPVTLAITTGTGTAGAVLSGTATVNAVAGVATFSGLSINLVGTGYTLTANSTGLTAAASTAFNVTVGAAAKVAFTTQPAGAAGGVPFTTQPVVRIQDAAGNTVTTSTASVTLAITAGTGTAGAVLSGTATMNAVAGVATFAGISINLAGAGYTLTATSIGLTAATSAVFTVNLPPVPAAPSGLYVNAVSGGQAELHWTDNSNNESGFNIERAPDIGGLGPGTYAPIGTSPAVGANITVYTDVTVVPQTAYWYRVSAVNAGGSSFPSNQVRILTLVSAPQITLTQPAGGTLISGSANPISADAAVSGTNITSAEYQLIANNAPGTFDALDVYSTPMDLTVLAARAPAPINDPTDFSALSLPAGAIAEYEIRGRVTAVNAGTGQWQIGTPAINVYESVTGQTQSTKFVGSRRPAAGDAVKITAYRNIASSPLIAKEIRFMAPAPQTAAAPSVTKCFLFNGAVQSMDAPVTAPGYLVNGEIWNIGGGDFRIDNPDFPAYFDSNIGIGTNATVRFAAPMAEANIARQIFQQVTTAIQTTTDVNPEFDYTPVPLNVPEGTWVYVIVDGVVSAKDLIKGVWTIGEEQIKCYESAGILISPATVGDEVLIYARRTLTPGPLVIEQIHNILPGPLIQPYKETAVEVHLMYNGIIQSMGPNTWTVAGPAGTPVTFIVDDPEGKARIDPMPLPSFAVGNPVTVEFDHVGEVLPDNANWAPMTQTAGSNTWTATVNPPAVPANRNSNLFLRTTDAKQQSSTSVFPVVLGLMPTSAPNAPTLVSAAQTGAASVTLTWTPAATGDGAASFIVERALSTAPTVFTSVGTPAASPFVDSSVVVGNTYIYRVKGVNTLGPGAPSNTMNVQVMASSPPTDLEAAILSATSVQLSWVDNATNETGYRVERSTDNFATVTVDLTPAPLAANATGFADITVTNANTTVYQYRITAIMATPPNFSATIATSLTAPTPPSGVTTTVTASVTVTWTDTNNETGYQVLRGDLQAGPFIAVANPGNNPANPTPPNATSFVDSTAVVGNTYWYQVVALGAVVGNSTPVTSPTSIMNDVPAIPAALAAIAVYPQITLTWTDNSNNENTFRIDRATNAAFDANLLTRDAPPNADASASYIDTAVTPGTTYYYRVAAVNGLSPVPPAFTTPPVTVMAASQIFSGGGGGGGGGGVYIPAGTSVTTSGLSGSLRVNASGVAQAASVLESPEKDSVLNISSGTKLNNAAGEALNQITLSNNLTPPGAPQGKAIIGVGHEFGPDGALFDPPITLKIKYNAADLPQGVTPDNLAIGFWSNETWQMLPSQVDEQNSMVSASISHFTLFAVISPKPEPPKAQFSFSNLVISPSSVRAGGTIGVQVVVTNTSAVSGTSKVDLKINGALAESKETLIPAGANATVVFSVVGKAPGNYNIDVNGLTGTFGIVSSEPVEFTPTPAPVTKPAPVTPAPAAQPAPQPVPAPAPVPTPFNWWLVGGGVIGIVVIVLLIGYTRRRT